jgi:hypothetical protein
MFAFASSFFDSADACACAATAVAPVVVSSVKIEKKKIEGLRCGQKQGTRQSERADAWPESGGGLMAWARMMCDVVVSEPPENQEMEQKEQKSRRPSTGTCHAIGGHDIRATVGTL